LRLFQSAIDDISTENNRTLLLENITLVPHGGYGRRDVAPFSDVDLMLLHHRSVTHYIPDIAGRMIADISDVGLDVGFSVRTPAQACQLSKRDPVIFTSLVESRALTGSDLLFEKYMGRFRTSAQRNSRRMMRRIDEARRSERRQYGETVFLLEPNVKRSRGALRDIHLLRWIGFARYGHADPNLLNLQGFLDKEDERAVRKAHEFLLKLRNEMHFHAGRPYDVLFRAEQMRIAELWSYETSESVLAVERFMSEYFEHTRHVRDIVGYFITSSQERAWLSPLIAPLVTYRMEKDFRVGPVHIGATRKGLDRLRGDLTEVLRLMDLANQMNKRIEHKTWNAVRLDLTNREDMVVTDEAAKRFMSLLSYNSRLGSLLRRLNEVGALQQLVAGLDHARFLLQFNRYHKYTVDTHCILSVEKATDFQTDPGAIGRAYRSIRKRGLLHLALLIHDLGKGLPGDHSEVGAELALETAKKLRLSRNDTETLHFLVLKHLSMSHLAFRRDTSDESILVKFAAEVGSPERMKMLFVLTAADLASVGPGVLNAWKAEVLAAVYERANFHLKGGATDAESITARTAETRSELLKLAPKEEYDWYKRQVQTLSLSILMENSPESLMADLKRLRTLEPRQAVAWGRYLQDRKVTEYAVGLHQQLTPGIFHRLTGALTGKGLQILSASIHTLADGLILDRFYVDDPDYVDVPPDDRLHEVGSALVKAIESPEEITPTFRQVWQPTSAGDLPDATIIDVFAHDRVGLLYAIARTLYELNLSVRYAKIGTYLDQVVDVFYVNDLEGGKIEDESRLDTIRERLLQAIEASNQPS
jgi:[protein-PII] uridylyltransferase